MAQATSRPSNFNVPNTLTAMRLVLSIIVFALIAFEWYIPALVAFVVTAGTDWVDGYWARKYGQVTQLGRIFDPFADKIAICGTFIFLTAQPGSGIPAWMTVVVVGRELLVTALRSLIEQRGGDFSASMAGKLKMVFQCAAVVASLIALRLVDPDVEPHTNWWGSAVGLPLWLNLSLLACVWLAVCSTVQSGVDYIFKAMQMMKQPA